MSITKEETSGVHYFELFAHEVGTQSVIDCLDSATAQPGIDNGKFVECCKGAGINFAYSLQTWMDMKNNTKRRLKSGLYRQ